MSKILTPPFNTANEITVFEGEMHQVVWFIDYTSKTTKQLRNILQRSVQRFEEYDMAFAVRFYPSPENKEESELAARAAIAAHAQGKFYDMHHALFRHEDAYTSIAIQQLASDIGLNLEQFESDLFSDETSERLSRDIESASKSAPVPRSPMLFIDGHLYEGAWDDSSILEAIEQPLGVRLQLASTRFFDWAAASGLVLVVATILALFVVNFGWAEQYEHLRETMAGLSFGGWKFELSLEAWINDGLMALFFLIVGIEIKRELIDGELSSLASAALPLIAAIGGMLVPAAVYALVNWGEPTVKGWAIPMATDIAFTLGILALLGNKIPTSLKVFVSALAIADDLGAIIVIAVFYGHGFQMDQFLYACLVFSFMIALNIGRVYTPTPYLILGAILWYFTHESGLHATLAGVLTAIAIPSRPSAQIKGVALQASRIFAYELRNPDKPAGSGSVLRLQSIIDRLRDPGFHLQHLLGSWSNFLILPLFAFFNTGIIIIGASFSLLQPEVLGVILGPLIGKPLGIFVFVYVAVKLGLARLSPEINWTHILGAGLLCGVGFTMSIFISSAAFQGEQLQSVKLAVLLASVLAAILGTFVLMKASKAQEVQ